MIKLGKAANGLLLGLAASIMFALSAVSLFLDRSATAAIAGAVALTFILLIKLPIVESFEVLTLKVKLRHQVDEANQLLQHIRSTASVTSKLSYIQLAFMNRLGNISWSQKRALLKDVDGMLLGLGISGDEINEWKRPFLNLITRDFASILWSSIERVKQRHFNAAQKEIADYERVNKPVAPNDPALSGLRANAQRYAQRPFTVGDVLQGTHLGDPDDLTRDWVQPELFDAKEISALRTIRDEVCVHIAECWASGTITKAAEGYLDGIGHREDKRIEELLAVVN